MWDALAWCGRAAELQGRLGPALQQKVMPVLGQALQQFLELVLEHLEAHVAEPRVQALGCTLVGNVAGDASGRHCLDRLPAVAAVVRAAVAHPDHTGVQASAWWALGNLEGARALRHLVEQPGLGRSSCAVRGALQALADLEQRQLELCRSPREGAEVTGVVLKILDAFPTDESVQKDGLTTFAMLLDAHCPQEQVVRQNVLRATLMSMHRLGADIEVVSAGARALVKSCRGHDASLRALRAEAALKDFIEQLFVYHAVSTASQLTSLAEVYLLVQGASALVQLIDRMAKAPEANGVVTALLEALAQTEEHPRLDANSVRVLCSLGDQGSGGEFLRVTIEAVGRISEFLLQDDQHGVTAVEGANWVFGKLRSVACDRSVVRRNLDVYDAVFPVLTSCALRSQSVYNGLLGAGIGALTEKVFEDDYWLLPFDTLQKALYAMALFGSVDAVVKKLVDYPDAPLLAEAAFHMLTSITDATDPIADDGILARCAPAVLDRCHHASGNFTKPSVLLRLCGCIAAYLAHAPADPALLDKSAREMASILQRFVSNKDSLFRNAIRGVSLALDTCTGERRVVIAQALNEVNIDVPLMQSCQAEDATLVQESVMALALLRGPAAMLRLLEDFPTSTPVQAAAIRGLGEIARRRISFSDVAVRQRVLSNLEAASAHPELEHWVSTAKGLIENMSETAPA